MAEAMVSAAEQGDLPAVRNFLGQNGTDPNYKSTQKVSHSIV